MSVAVFATKRLSVDVIMQITGSLGKQCPVACSAARCRPVQALSSSAKPFKCASRALFSKTESLSASPLLLGSTHGAARSYPGLHAPRGRSCVKVQAYNSSKPDIADRVVSSIPYLIPLFDGLRYGKFFFLEYPSFAKVLLPLEPLMRIYFSIPFIGLIAFFAVYLGIINNRNFSRYVRFNAMQAVLLDILLVLPGVLEMVFRRPSDGFLLQVYITAYNSIWLFTFACFAYGVGSCLVGQTARLPVVGDAADQQVM